MKSKSIKKSRRTSIGECRFYSGKETKTLDIDLYYEWWIGDEEKYIIKDKKSLLEMRNMIVEACDLLLKEPSSPTPKPEKHENKKKRTERKNQKN